MRYILSTGSSCPFGPKVSSKILERVTVVNTRRHLLIIFLDSQFESVELQSKL